MENYEEQIKILKAENAKLKHDLDKANFEVQALNDHIYRMEKL